MSPRDTFSTMVGGHYSAVVVRLAAPSLFGRAIRMMGYGKPYPYNQGAMGIGELSLTRESGGGMVSPQVEVNLPE